MNYNKILPALKQMIESDPDIINTFINGVVSEEYINNSPDLCPWIGIYKGAKNFEPRSLGADNWEVSGAIRIIAQASSLKSGEECSTLIEDYVRKIVAVIRSDSTIKGTVDMVNNFTVDYRYNELDRFDMYFQTAIITINVEDDDAN